MIIFFILDSIFVKTKKYKASAQNKSVACLSADDEYMAGERGSVRKNNRRHLSCMAVFNVCECQLVFSVENKFGFDHDK